MQIIAEKRVLELSENDVCTLKTIYLVQSGETIEALLRRMGLNGNIGWHYDQAEIRLKLVKPEKER